MKNRVSTFERIDFLRRRRVSGPQLVFQGIAAGDLKTVALPFYGHTSWVADNSDPHRKPCIVPGNVQDLGGHLQPEAQLPFGRGIGVGNRSRAVKELDVLQFGAYLESVGCLNLILALLDREPHFLRAEAHARTEAQGKPRFPDRDVFAGRAPFGFGEMPHRHFNHDYLRTLAH